MAWICELCGRQMDAAPTDPVTGNWRCPDCGAAIQLASTEVAPPVIGETSAAGSPSDVQKGARSTASRADHHEDGRRPQDVEGSSVDTVFQPILMMESIMDELDEPDALLEEATSRDPGTETLETDPTRLPSPFLQLDVEAYLLILGANPGQERRPLLRAKTSFGRKGADVVLEDPAVSGLHFQIEAFGKEFFLRDLDSRNGTFLNGNKVRYSQLLAGDQITAGKTSLIFRTSDDKIDRG